MSEARGEVTLAELAADEEKSKQNSALLTKIAERYTEAELRAIAAGARLTPGLPRVPIVEFEGEEICFAAIGDLHIGSVYFVEDWFFQMLDECAKREVQRIEVVGDVTEGMSRREGHVYELTHIGFARQKEYAYQLFSCWDGPIDMIDGNHDRWFLKNANAGANIVEDICQAIGPRACYVGSDEGNVVMNGAVVKLWHGEDSSSYATSYRVQKLIEAFSPGEKPNILLCGHTHKQIDMFSRSIHALSCGAMSRQSRWMRSKRLECHPGFWIVRATINAGGVAAFEPRWYPFYA